MSLKLRSLGATTTAAVRGILITTGTNATPIVATVTAGHRLKDTDRIGIAGVTTLTAMNGDWEVKRVTDTTYQLLTSRGNGAFGGTAVVAALCDKTPFMPRHSAVGFVGQHPNASAVLVGTVVFEGADQIKSDGTEFGYSVAGVYTSGFITALKTGEVVIPASVAGTAFGVEVDLFRYMTFRVSAWTSGGAMGFLMA